MKPRAGVTLIEVLVAIMLCSVGLLALLTLFPLGAMEMAQAVKDDRCGHYKHNLAAIANMERIRHDPEVQRAMLDPSSLFGQPPTPPPPPAPPPPVPGEPVPEPIPVDPTIPVLFRPLATDPTDENYAADSESISYPVYIDPIGFNTNFNAGNVLFQDWVGGGANRTMRRVSYGRLDPQRGMLVAPAELRRWCCFLDSITFRTNDESALGLSADPLSNPLVDRSLTYSCAYLVQMPKVRTPEAVNLTVVIYSGRALDDPGVGETIYSAHYDPVGSTVTLTVDALTGQSLPGLKVGNWILDTTMSRTGKARFYRVVSIKELSDSEVELEVFPPPTHSTLGKPAVLPTPGLPIGIPAVPPIPGTAVVMENVVEAFERGQD